MNSHYLPLIVKTVLWFTEQDGETALIKGRRGAEINK